VQLPSTLREALPTDPRMSARNLDLVNMIGASQSSVDGTYAQIRFTLQGLDLTTRVHQSHEITLTLDVTTARKVARYLEDVIDHLKSSFSELLPA
jgi:hypothetical protein